MLHKSYPENYLINNKKIVYLYLIIVQLKNNS